VNFCPSAAGEPQQRQDHYCNKHTCHESSCSSRASSPVGAILTRKEGGLLARRSQRAAATTSRRGSAAHRATFLCAELPIWSDAVYTRPEECQAHRDRLGSCSSSATPEPAAKDGAPRRGRRLASARRPTGERQVAARLPQAQTLLSGLPSRAPRGRRAGWSEGRRPRRDRPKVISQV